MQLHVVQLITYRGNNEHLPCERKHNTYTRLRKALFSASSSSIYFIMHDRTHSANSVNLPLAERLHFKSFINTNDCKRYIWKQTNMNEYTPISDPCFGNNFPSSSISYSHRNNECVNLYIIQ